MIQRTSSPRVHGNWTRDWWAGDPRWEALLGPAPSSGSLAACAQTLNPDLDWSSALHPVSRSRPAAPAGSLVILAGQQPVFGGGAALVAHKAATAVTLAREASALLGRSVVPVFLLATQDHDGPEVDHIDCFMPSNGGVHRTRCRVSPGHDMFSRSNWESEPWPIINRLLESLNIANKDHLAHGLRARPVADHAAWLLDQTLGSEGLLIVEAHRLHAAAMPVLAQALTSPELLQECLLQGATGLRDLGLVPAFDPVDPRPLLLESREGRRLRLEPGDGDAGARLQMRPQDFSPHAALRPVVQALSLPVLAQVAGPSELLYLAQARQLHHIFDAAPPVLVPRMEATRLPFDLMTRLGEAALDPQAGQGSPAADDLLAAAQRFTRSISLQDPNLLPRLERFTRGLRRATDRLAAMPSWRGKAARGMRAMVRPRGRPQDAVLAWLPDALLGPDLPTYGRHLCSLCQPLKAPVHMLHTYPETDDG